MATLTQPVVHSQSCRFRLTENLECYQIVWLDQNTTRDQENLLLQRYLREVSNYVILFDKPTECKEHILKFSKVILILTDRFVQEFLPVVHDLAQVNAVYIYSALLEKKNDWSQRYSKVKGIFYDSAAMINQLKRDQYLRERMHDRSIGINIYNLRNSDRLEERNAMFIHFQLFLEIILNMKPAPDRTRKELLDFLRSICHDNDEQLQIIDEFDHNYSGDRAIWWYTRYTLFYSCLNQALRNHDFDVLTAFRFFIIDLYKQLSREHRNYLATLDETNIQVYRGQAINGNELRLIKDSIGEFVSMNSFLSTTIKRETAIFFAESSTTESDSLKRILFEFDIDSTLMSAKPFANVRHLSHYADEDEVLISLGTIFRIKGVQLNSEQNIWIAKLELCSSDDFALKEIFEHEKKLMQPTPSLLHLGKLLGNMGSYEKQKKLIQQLLNESDDVLEQENCYLLLGQSARFLKDYNAALDYSFKGLDLQNKAGVDGLYVGQTYIAIAEVYLLKLEFDLALEYAQKSLTLIPEDHFLCANAYRLMGKAHSKKGEYEQSLDYCKKALEVQTKTLPKDDKDIGLTYYWMAIAYENMNNYSMALQFLNESLRITRKNLPPSHGNIRVFEEHIKCVQEKVNTS